MARLASESGGRYTELTNDLSLAYARAQRDLACKYTVGFYLEQVEDDTVRAVSVRVRRPGMRAIHPARFAFRSKAAERESILRAAYLSPELFDTGLVRAHVFPLRPTARRTWEGLLAISFPVPLTDTFGINATREFGAVLYDGARAVHRFNRRITLQPESPEVTSEPLITFLEPVELEPRAYELSVVLSDPAAIEPHAAKVTVEVPAVPRRELFLVGPMLGRPSGTNLVITGGDGRFDTMGEADSFEPLLVHSLDEPVDVLALTQACYVGKKPPSSGSTPPAVTRSLRNAAGDAVGELVPVELTFEADERVRCQNLVDVLPARSVAHGEYVFEAALRSGRPKHDVNERVKFVVGSARSLPDDDAP